MFYIIIIVVFVIFFIWLLYSRKTNLYDPIAQILMTSDFKIGTSQIQGIGLFTKRDRTKGEKLFVAINTDEIITPIGSKINHCPGKTTDDGTSVIPNTYLSTPDTTTGDWWITAVRDIKTGEELTVDYTNTPAFIDKPDKNWKCPMKIKH